MKNLFDIVIPIGPHDREVIKKQIIYTKKNIIGYRNIYLISYNPKIIVKGCITIDENIFPFTIDTVKQFHGGRRRNGWYLQQLLKLYAGFIIPNILDRYLVIDSDTFFLKPTRFVRKKKCLYGYGDEDWKPYFIHMKRLDETFEKVFPKKSGICHHMIFEKKFIKEIIDIIEKNHGDKFYNVFLKHAEISSKSGASEYELYFNYIMKNHPNEIEIRN